MNLRVHGQAGQTLLEVLRGSDHSLRAPCAGRGSCGKCRVEVCPPGPAAVSPLGAAEPLEWRHLSEAEQSRGVRLACLSRFAREGWVELIAGDDGIAVPQEQLSIVIDPTLQARAASSGRPLGVAVDIGTTTLAVALVEVAQSRVLSVHTAANAQKTWGSDVVARIQAVIDHPEALEAMRKAVVGQIEALVRQQLVDAGREPAELDTIAVAGNTVMLHLFAGADPTGMARVPFRPVFLESRLMPAPSVGFALPSTCTVQLLPGISAFVGGDITAGVLATGLDHADELELLLDIGTNGEMVLGNRHSLSSTATAAGPAFEGAQITHGCPGVPGALDHAGWTPATDAAPSQFWYTTIGDKPLSGICGSGLLDLAAALRRGGQLDETGYLELAEGDDFFPDANSPVCLSQADIRQLQLAKGAIAAGIEVLCQNSGVGLEQIARVHLAGGFGTFLRPASALAIGLLPQSLRGKVIPSGNTALKGALLVLADSHALTRAAAIAKTAVAVDLSAEPAFQMAFAEAMLFPEEPGDDD